MYLDDKYFNNEAENLLRNFKFRTTKVTSGIDKGRYTSEIIIPELEKKDSEKYLIEKFGTKIPTWTKVRRDTKEESEKQMIRDVAYKLLEDDRRKNNQYFSDLYNLWKNKKDYDDIFLKGRIGYIAYTFFELINGKYNKDNFSNKNNNFTYEIQKKLETIKDFKEFYFVLKQLTKEEWLKNNIFYTNKFKPGEKEYFKVDTFKFDEEKISEISIFENELENKKPLQKIEIPIAKNLKNDGFYKIGYRNNFLNSPILYGRERIIVLANGEKHKSLFAIVELDKILTSHNENNFSNTENYPTNKDGRNINDRNYSGDINAQSKVISVSQNLIPEIIISTSATASGTPIISVDGIVVSGNNRTMSLKLAKNQNKSQYDNYLKKLAYELGYEGYGFKDNSIGTSLLLKYKISLPGSSFNNPLSIKFENPILVRIDYDFQSYTTDEMAKYNKSTKKSERPIDNAIKISQQLKENSNCMESLLSLISEQEIVSDLYNDVPSVKRFKSILIECNLITENDISSLFIANTLTDNGKTFYDTLLLSLILNPEILEISQNQGIKSIINSVSNSIIYLNQNKNLKEGSIIDNVNNAIILQNEIYSTKSKNIIDFIKQGNLFEKSIEFITYNSIIINYWLNKPPNEFKKTLKKYNSLIEDSLLPNIFGEKLSVEEIFKEIFENGLPEDLKNALNLVFKKDNVVINDDYFVFKEEDYEKDNEINTNFEQKSAIEKEIAIMQRAAKYDNTDETKNIIKALKTTLKYI